MIIGDSPSLRVESVIIMLQETSLEEREDWARFALECLARAYGDDEPEYSSDLIKEENPEYEGELPPRSGPIPRLGNEPVDDEITDASENHDRYIYNQ
jgi:hypothetical protein